MAEKYLYINKEIGNRETEENLARPKNRKTMKWISCIFSNICN